MGSLTGHFGHFITHSLARLWPLAKITRTNTKLVLFNHGPLSTPLGIPWLRDILAAFDVSQDDFINFDRPTRFCEIIVPAPAFEEGNFAHSVFGTVCRIAGCKLRQQKRTSGAPVFLTKANLTTGTSNIKGEQELCRHLKRAGFRIISPERLSILEQVSLFYDSSILYGIAGSAFHTAVFAPGRVKFELQPETHRSSNQSLLDAMNGGHSFAVFPQDDIKKLAFASAGFTSIYRLTDPARTAAEFVKLIENIA